MTTPALPVMPELVECVPYRTRLLPRACAERWEIARTLERTKRTKNAEKSGPTYDRQRVEKCVGCPVGERRAAELGGVPKMTPIHDARGTSWKKKRSPPVKPPVIRSANVSFELAIDRESATHPQAGVQEDPMKCRNCKATFEPRKSDQVYCSKECRLEDYAANGGPVSKRSAAKAAKVARVSKVDNASAREEAAAAIARRRGGDVSTSAADPKPTSPFLLWVQLQDRVDERKRIAAESIAAAEADLARFEEDHPDVVVIGTQRLERALAVRSARDTTKPTTPTPPRSGVRRGAARVGRLRGVSR